MPSDNAQPPVKLSLPLEYQKDLFIETRYVGSRAQWLWYTNAICSEQKMNSSYWPAASDCYGLLQTFYTHTMLLETT